MLTLNQKVNKLREIQESHDQLSSFYFGDPDDLTETIDYPVMGAILQEGNLVKGQLTTKIILYFADLVSEDFTNKTEVLSDMQRVGLGVFSQFCDYLNENDIQLAPEASIKHFEGAGPHGAWGWQIDVSVNEFFSNDKCQEPSDFDPAAEESGTSRIYNITTGATVDTLNPGEDYGVLVFSGINDTGAPYTNSIVDNG
jgi:hypothetical protein